MEVPLTTVSGLTPPATPINAKGAATVIAIFPAKPFTLVTVIVVVFAPPRAMFMNDGFALMVKPGPVNTMTDN